MEMESTIKTQPKNIAKAVTQPVYMKRSLIPIVKHIGCRWLHAKFVAYRFAKRDTAMQRQRFSEWPHEPCQPHEPRQ